LQEDNGFECFHRTISWAVEVSLYKLYACVSKHAHQYLQKELGRGRLRHT